jgi:hypothetical protein
MLDWLNRRREYKKTNASRLESLQRYTKAHLRSKGLIPPTVISFTKAEISAATCFNTIARIAADKATKLEAVLNGNQAQA